MRNIGQRATTGGEQEQEERWGKVDRADVLNRPWPPWLHRTTAGNAPAPSFRSPSTSSSSGPLSSSAAPDAPVANRTTRRGVYRYNTRCVNCGCLGHIYRECSLPITSYGLICFRWAASGRTGERVPQYVMVQRKYSLCFIDFVRGKYDLRNRDYIRGLLERMTRVERERLASMTFAELWYGFWQTESSRCHQRELQQAADKFKAIREGYFLRPHPSRSSGGSRGSDGGADSCDTSMSPPPLHWVSLRTLLDDTESRQAEPEWGFPKGRRDIRERDLSCAIREFKEETGIDFDDVHVHTSFKPFDEVFIACNHVRYRHVYYIAQMKQRQKQAANPGGGDDRVALLPDAGRCVDLSLYGHRSQLREVGRVSWMDAPAVFERISSHSVARRKMFEKVHAIVTSHPSLSPEQLPGPGPEKKRQQAP